MKFLITGGGTGGHIYPALSIANEIKERYKNSDILYVGTKEGLESELVPKEGFKFETIRVEGLPRKLSKESIISSVKLIHGIFDSRKIINKFKPDIIIGTGGYVSGPVVYVGSKKKIPSIIHEQNAFPGITNKILSRYVTKIAVSFHESEKYFKYPGKIVFTGNPIRKSIISVNKEEAFKKLNIDPDIPFILSFGGSGGQKKLNDAMYWVVKKVASHSDVQIMHVTGKRFYSDFAANLKKDGIILKNNIKILPYFFDMPLGLNTASLVITSGGAIAIAELTALGVPSIIIPKSYTAENHQVYNGKAIEKAGAGLLILEKDLTGEKLYESIMKLIKDKNKLYEMSLNSKNIGRTNAASKIVDIVETILK
jgi:UDP-N-acetylglucosamine--N-acetylmuramyl-(pentapeptide) pyrophosphoryl-undecaprenol N-acetylglucosamine transferase